MRLKADTSGLERRTKGYKNLARKALRAYGNGLLSFVREKMSKDTGAAARATQQTISEVSPGTFAIVLRPNKKSYTDLKSKYSRRPVTREPVVYWFALLKKSGLKDQAYAKFNSDFKPAIRESLANCLNGIYKVEAELTKKPPVVPLRKFRRR